MSNRRNMIGLALAACVVAGIGAGVALSRPSAPQPARPDAASSPGPTSLPTVPPASRAPEASASPAATSASASPAASAARGIARAGVTIDTPATWYFIDLENYGAEMKRVSDDLGPEMRTWAETTTRNFARQNAQAIFAWMFTRRASGRPATLAVSTLAERYRGLAPDAVVELETRGWDARSKNEILASGRTIETPAGPVLRSEYTQIDPSGTVLGRAVWYTLVLPDGRPTRLALYAPPGEEQAIIDADRMLSSLRRT